MNSSIDRKLVLFFFPLVQRYRTRHMYDYSERVRILLTVHNGEPSRTRIRRVHGDRTGEQRAR